MNMLDQIEALYDNWDYDEKNFVRNYPRSETSVPFLINESHSSSKNEDDHSEPDAEVSKILDEIYARLLQLHKRGISTRTIHEKLLERQILSRLVFSSDNQLLLPDYGNLEVVLTPLPKALYLLFLRHPEGITLKQLSVHRNELTQLYAQLAPNINPVRRMQHIEALINPLSNSLNEKVSIIRRAFASVLDTSLLPFYVIDGNKGGIYSIKLPQSMFIC